MKGFISVLCMAVVLVFPCAAKAQYTSVEMTPLAVQYTERTVARQGTYILFAVEFVYVRGLIDGKLVSFRITGPLVGTVTSVPPFDVPGDSVTLIEAAIKAGEKVHLLLNGEPTLKLIDCKTNPVSCGGYSLGRDVDGIEAFGAYEMASGHNPPN